MNIERLKSTFLALLAIYSPFKRELKTNVYIKAYLDQIGAAYYEDESSQATGCDCGNLIVGDSGHAALSFVSHMDTIQIYGTPEITIDDEGVIKGENGGVIGIDDKCGIAVMLEMIAVLMDNGGIPKGVHFVFLTDEELEFSGAWNVPERHFISALNYVLDSGKTPIGFIVIKGASHYCFEIKVTGVMSHVGNLTGAHSLLACTRIIGALQIGRKSEQTVLNISNIRCESNPSTVPKVAVAEGQLLSFNEDEAAKLLREIENTAIRVAGENGCSAEFSCVLRAPGFQAAENSAIVNLAKAAALQESLDFSTGKTGAGSDAHVISHRGGQAIKISTGMMNVHTDQENININDMAKCVRYCLAIISGHAAMIG